jgi:hypothetical protein
MIGCPKISYAEYPKTFSAAAFQLVIMPSKLSPMMAASEDCTIAASCAAANSTRLRSVMSRNVHILP